jgi:hypothetical protein
MKNSNDVGKTMLAVAVAALAGGVASVANAIEPCGDFGECKALIEINASDGDIGFHFLMDGDDLIRAAIYAPNHRKIFYDGARGALREQFLTETFVESAEPLCFDPLDDDDLENDEDDFVTLEDFVDRWQDGTYTFFGIGDGWEFSFGQTTLGIDLPAAPNLDADDGFGFDGSIISWGAGDDLGECADYEELMDLVDEEVLPVHPANVPVVEWEVVFEADIPGNLKYSARVPGNISPKQITVPADFLAALPADTPAKIEVGAIGAGDNATFSEEGDICVNEDEGCDEEE